MWVDALHHYTGPDTDYVHFEHIDVTNDKGNQTTTGEPEETVYNELHNGKFIYQEYLSLDSWILCHSAYDHSNFTFQNFSENCLNNADLIFMAMRQLYVLDQDALDAETLAMGILFLKQILLKSHLSNFLPIIPHFSQFRNMLAMILNAA